MAKVSSKLQVTIPKAVADRTGIRPEDEIAWVAEDHSIRVHRMDDRRLLSAEERLAIFDDATARQARRNAAWRRKHG